MKQFLLEMLDYIDNNKIKNKLFTNIVMDEGSEFKSVF